MSRVLRRSPVAALALALLSGGAAFAQPKPRPAETLPLRELEEAAKNGRPDALFELAQRHEDGRGMAPDAKAALAWLHKAADAGDARALFQLGIHHFPPVRVARDRLGFWVRADPDARPDPAFVLAEPDREFEEQRTLAATVDALKRLTEKDADALRRLRLSALLRNGERGGYAADTSRHPAVEAREPLSVVMVDGSKGGDKATGPSRYLNHYFADATTGGRGYVVTHATAAGLETADLSRCALLMLVNVPALSEAAVKTVEGYVKNGGGCGVFLGEAVKPADYNKFLHRGGAGFFPVPLPDGPTPKLTEEQLAAKLLMLSSQKFLLRDPKVRTHPALFGLYHTERGQPVKPGEEIVRWSQFVTVQRHFKIDRKGKWRDDKAVTELFCMPNEGDIKEYADAVTATGKKLTALLGEPEMEKYRKAVAACLDDLRKALLADDTHLGWLAIQFDRLLCDGRSENDPNEPLLREFWARPKAADLRAEVARLRDWVKFGDPLYLAKTFGRGRVTAFLTSPDDSWTDWPSSPPATYCFAPIIGEMAKHLAGRSDAVEDANKAVEWYSKGANAGSLPAMNNLGLFLQAGLGGAADAKKAAEWFAKAAAGGNTSAMLNLGHCYAGGTGVARDLKAAIRWYAMASAAGSVPAKCHLGFCFQAGVGGVNDAKEAVEWFTKAAEAGDAQALCALAFCRQKGVGVPEDAKGAVERYTKAAVAGNAQAMWNLGLCLANGRGAKQDTALAGEWFERAAHAGHAPAMRHLAWTAARGQRERDPQEAVNGYTGAARRGDPKAMTNLGWHAANGVGMTADEKAAVEWFVKAAALGDHRAMINLGWCYSAGIGVARNAKAAAKWYGKAADGGPDGLDELLWFYANGIGSGKDEKEARQSVREALASGNEKARAALKALGGDDK